MRATAGEMSAGLAGEIAAAADPCCDRECPDDPVCGAANAMTARCGLQAFWPLQTGSLEPAVLRLSARAPISDRILPCGPLLEHLRRPPRV
jgi:hypothetical protein